MELPNRYIVLDVETANKNQASICQIGITYVQDQRIESINSFNINPEEPFDAYNKNLHGITERAVENSKTFIDAYPYLKQILSIVPVFQHSDFDERAISAACSKYMTPQIAALWLSSIEFFKYYWPSSPSYKLEYLSKANHISINHHDAAEDSFATAQLLNIAKHGKELILPNSILEKNSSGIFTGETIVFSGDMNKSLLKQRALSSGFTVLESVTKKTDYLCLGKTDQRTIDSGNTKSSKHKKAVGMMQNGHHIQIISEEEFYQLTS